MLWSILTGKAALFSPIRPHAAIAKKRQTQVASCACWAIAVSSEVGAGSREENASEQNTNAYPF
jgi:hypothetical protein